MATQRDRNKRYRLDSLERGIISELLDDARKPFQVIARELGVDEKTVRNRVAKLRRNEVINFVPLANPDHLEHCITAIIAIKFTEERRRKPEQLAREIADHPMVSWVGTVMGRYDIFVEVVVDSWESLTRFQLEELPKIEGISSSEGFLMLSQFGRRGICFVPELLD